jgi:nitroreductase
VGVLRETTSSAAGDAGPSALVTRRSIRKYLDKPLPDELVQQVLVEARWAPSSSNTQSTYVYALSGRPFEQFKADLRKNSEDEVPPASDLDARPQWPPRFEARRNELMQIRSTWCAAEEERMGLKPHIWGSTTAALGL